MTTLQQVEAARACVRRTGRKYFCYYSERVHTGGGLFAEELIRQGAIGRVIHVKGRGVQEEAADPRADAGGSEYLCLKNDGLLIDLFRSVT